MHELLVRRVPGHRIDVDRIVRLISEGIALRTIPLLPRSKVALPIQLVYDVGLFAGPLGLDLRAFLEAVKAESGPGLDRLAFRYRSSDGCGAGPAWEWRQYQIPSRASSVVLVSGNYGADVASRVAEFHWLMAELRRRGHNARAVWFGDMPDERGPLRREQWLVRSR